MIAIKSKPVGIDVSIQAFQNRLYTQLQTIWAMQAADYTCYGRAYRNQTEDGYIPEAYTGSGEYVDTLFDDTVKVTSFFGMGENQKYEGGLETTIFLIFMLDLSKIKPGITWRPDEEVRRDVENLCKLGTLNFMLTGVETGIDNVFRDYSGWKKKDGIKYRDMYPWHCFRLNFNIKYGITNC